MPAARVVGRLRPVHAAVMGRNHVMLVMLVAACGGAPAPSGDADVVGPFTGPVHRFVVDDVFLPTTAADRTAVSADLDGEGGIDNQLSGVLNLLEQGGNLNAHHVDMIRAGALASVVEIQADDLDEDDAVGVTYLGREGDPAVALGGTLVRGQFVSNRTATARALGRATLRLPAIADVEPSVIVLDAMEAEMIPDGVGGYTALLRGGVGDDALAETARGLRAMILADPQGHPNAIALFDADRNGDVSLAEITTNSLITAVFASDVMLWVDGAYVPRMSFAFRVHLSPCAAGTCAAGAPAEPCFDRVQDGSETGIDCGGGCRACEGGEPCDVPTDCQSEECSAGVCAAPSCGDGVVSGFETDVDCGWNCAACAPGESCESGLDCASGTCNGATTCQ